MRRITRTRHPRRLPGSFPQCVMLRAMKHTRAALPAPGPLCKGLLCRGFPNDLGELGRLARRYLLPGDAPMLLAESELGVQAPGQTVVVAPVELEGHSHISSRTQD